MSKEIQELFEKKWYYMSSNEPQGPLCHIDLVKKLQDKDIFDYQYVWAPHYEEWKMFCEAEEFSKKYIQWVYDNLFEKNGQFYFNRRNSTRKKVTCEVNGHNSAIFMTGHTESLSMNGCEVEFDYPLLQVHDQITVHCVYPQDLNLHFNALCQVLQKKYTPRKFHQKMKVKYILKFLDKSEEKNIASILSMVD